MEGGIGGRKLNFEGSCKEDLPKISRQCPKCFLCFVSRKVSGKGAAGDSYLDHTLQELHMQMKRKIRPKSWAMFLG